MAKIVVRKGKNVFVINQDTRQEVWDNLWLSRYALMNEFIKEYGHQLFPRTERSLCYETKYKSLASWAGYQRNRNNKATLIEWRYDYLVRVDFDFHPLETRWMNKYIELIEFKNTYGQIKLLISRSSKEETKKWQIDKIRLYLMKVGATIENKVKTATIKFSSSYICKDLFIELVELRC